MHGCEFDLCKLLKNATRPLSYRRRRVALLTRPNQKFKNLHPSDIEHYFSLLPVATPKLLIPTMSSSSRLGPPTSSGLAPTPSSSSLPQSRPIIDPLAFDNVRGLGGSLPNGNGPSRPLGAASEAGEDITGTRRGGRRARLEDTDAIPRVKHATGEKVMESFALFLEKSVIKLVNP